MLTIATITPEQGEQYYQQENYYSKDAALENSSWWGKGAASLGLSGQIQDSVAYTNVVHGKSPDGSQSLRAKPRNKETQERAGVDLTFSAPKSVSLACLVGGDSRLEEAHRSAVLRTLEIIEQRYAETRVKGQRINTGNLTVAMWHHDTSRELDPHLHTHCVVMNLTSLPNGKWQSRTDESLYYNKILLGRIYRNELALECRQLGYDIVAHPKELFEIKGYTREQIEAFSKRHEQILDLLAEIGAEATTENKVWAWRETRVKKNHVLDRKDMLPYWHEEADLYGVSHPVPDANPQLAPAQEVEAERQEAVKAGIEHCSERTVAFKTEDIEKFITAEIRSFGIGELQQAISSHPDLIQTFDNRFTTQSAIARELATIRFMQLGLNQVESIANPEAVSGYLSNKKLTIGQREAVQLAATTTDSFIAWQGVAGAGKTYALKELQQIAQGYTIKGFAPSAEAAQVLGEELGIEANTVARQLLTKQPESVQPNQIWIVDEAGLLSAKDAHALLQRATDEQARVILVGDTRQLSAVEAGSPFRSLQQAGIKTAYLNESVRQRAGSPDLQKAVRFAAAGEIARAINHLDFVGRIEQVPDAGERAALIAEQYIKLSPQERQGTLILAGTNAERLAITEQIRSRLKVEGSLGYGVEATKLKAKDLTQVQSRYTHYYLEGDVVMPKREYQRSGLHKFQPYVVEAVNRDSLTLSDLSGNTLTVDPMKFRKTVYTTETLEIAVGDRLRWTKNDASLGRRNGQEFTVTGIEDRTATISYKDGKTDCINLYQPFHLEHALVSTTYSSQGKTAEQVLISAAADRTLSQESFNVAISRAKIDLQIYAEDKDKLLELAQSSTAKENPLELLRQQVGERVAAEPVLRASQPVEQKEFDATQTQDQVLQAIVDYVEQQAVQTALTPQALLTLTQRLNQLTEVTKAAQQLNVAVAKHLEQDSKHSTQQHLEALANYIEAQTIEAALLEQNLKALIEQLSQLPSQEAAGTIQQLEAAEANYRAQAETTVISKEALELQAGQLLEALADYIETAATEATLNQPLIALIEKLSHLQEGVNKGQTNNQYKDAIAGYIEQEAIELEILPALENLVAQLNTLPPGKLPSLVPASPEPEIPEQLLSSITSFISRSAVEEALNSQSLQTLSVRLPQLGDPELRSAMQLLEAIVADYQVHLQAQALIQEALPIVEVIADSGSQTAINSAIAQSPEIVAPPFERTSEKPTRGEISDQPASQPPTSRENELPTDMAALFRAANRKLPSPPDWLVVGKRVHCQNQGWGEVTAILGARLVIKLDSGELAQIPEWPAAIESKLVSAQADTEHDVDWNEPRQRERLAVERFTDSELLLAQKAVREYVASQPPQPPSLDEQQAVQHEIDRLFNQINSLWSKQKEQVKLAESMQKNPFHAWSKKYDAVVKQLETTMSALSQSYAQKDQKESQQKQWSKQSKAYQEWSASPQTQAMRQLAADLSLPQVQSRLEALKQIQQEGRATAQAVRDMFMLTGTKRQADGSLILDGANWKLKQLGNTVSVNVKADNREILRVEGDKTLLFNPTPSEREKMQNFREKVKSELQKEQQRQLEAERKQSRGLSL